MKLVNWEEIEGDIVKDEERYIVEDNNFLNDLIVSKTTLHPQQSTKGHWHANIEEVYMCIAGSGRIEVDKEMTDIIAGDIVLIKEGLYHRVYNDSETTALEFISVFQTYDRTGKTVHYDDVKHKNEV